MAGIRKTPDSNLQTVTINYSSSATGQNPQLQIINSPGGGATQIQYNDGNGKFAGSPNMIWNNTNRILNILGTIRASNLQGKLTTNLTNFKLTGGNVGDTLTTDGTGNLSWVEGENYGNSNVANYLPNYSGNINAANINISNTVYTGNISVTGTAFLTTVSVNSTMNTHNITANGNVTANYFIGNGSQLTGFANVAFTGNYTNLTGIPTNVSAFTNDAGYITVSTANVVSVNGLTGAVTISDVATANYANYSNVAYSVDLANVVSIGNIASINLDGNASNILFGNGAFAELSIPEVYGNSNVANYLPTYTGNLSNIGNIVAYNASPAPSISGFSSVSAVRLSGEGGNISNIQASNISGLGNISTVNLDGNTSNILYGNGTFATAPTGGGYGNANVSTYLASFGSNTLTTTGNVTAGNLITSGNLNLSGNLGNVVFSTGAYITGNAIGREGSILLQPYTGAGSLFPGVKIGGAGRIIAPNDSVSIVLNASDITAQLPIKAPAYSASSTTSGGIQVTGGGGIGVTGNIYVGGNSVTGNNAIVAGVTGTLLPNSTASFFANSNSYTQITYQNKSNGSDATADFIVTADNGTDTVNYLDLGIINSGYDNGTPTNSLGNIVYAADSYLYSQGNVSNTSQSGGNLVLGATTPAKTVKIFAGGVNSNSIIATFSNTGVSVNGNVTANNFSGNINITGNVIGTSPNVTLVAGSYSWIFDNGGTLTIPATNIGTGNEGGEIDFGKAPNSTLSGNVIAIDQYMDRIRFFEGGGTARGAYIDLSQAADGVGTLLNNRVSGLVNAGTFVTMDLLKATVTTSGQRGLSLAATTGSFSINIGGNYSLTNNNTGGAAGVATITTTPTSAQFNWNFPEQGDISTYTITDTTNNRAYRITLQIGASYINNMISIERLV
jgi:hypothetical protein